MALKTHGQPGERSKRLLWFVLIYLGSLLAFAALVYGLKLLVPRA